MRAVVLTGAGSAFCAGGNVKDMRDIEPVCFPVTPLIKPMPIVAVFQRIPRAVYSLNVPAIAAGKRAGGWGWL